MFGSTQLEKISKLIKKPLGTIIVGLGITIASLGLAKTVKADYFVKNVREAQSGYYLVYNKDGSPVYYMHDNILIFLGKRVEKTRMKGL